MKYSFQESIDVAEVNAFLFIYIFTYTLGSAKKFAIPNGVFSQFRSDIQFDKQSLTQQHMGIALNPRYDLVICPVINLCQFVKIGTCRTVGSQKQ